MRSTRLDFVRGVDFIPVILRLWNYEKGRYLNFSLKKILLGNKEENNINTNPLFQFDGKFAVLKIREEDLSFGRNILNYKLNPKGSFVTARKIISKSAEEVKLIRSDLQFLSLQPSQLIGMKTKSDKRALLVVYEHTKYHRQLKSLKVFISKTVENLVLMHL